MRIYDIISKKRHKKELTKEELLFAVNGFVNGEIPDYQMSALLMAIACNSLTNQETSDLTEIMAQSGDMYNLSELGEFTADKHSTGGVGDKTTLIVAPIVACAGLKVAKMSGRGLGFTGGTADKLEAIKGYKISLPYNEFINNVKKTGVSVITQSGNLCKADKLMYALRDVTATVDSIPLIVSSIMSKKIASGAKTIVLDVKKGSGAFCKNIKKATELSEKMVDIGKRHNRKIAAVITDMDKPLGKYIGNLLEVKEAITTLKNETGGELKEVSLVLSAEMISLSKNISYEKAYKQAKEILESNKAFDKFSEWMENQGADLNFLKNYNDFENALYKKEIKAQKNGFVTKINAEQVGNVSVMLGAGRKEKQDIIDNYAGIKIEKNVGDKVQANDCLAVLYSNKKISKETEDYFYNAYDFGNKKPKIKPAVLKIIE